MADFFGFLIVAIGCFFALGGVGMLVKPVKGYRRLHGAYAAVLGGMVILLGGGIISTGHSAAASPDVAPAPKAAVVLTAAEKHEVDNLEDSVATFDDKATASTPTITSCNLMPYTSERYNCARIGALFAVSWPRAWRRDLTAQRLVSTCFSDGCQGTVALDPVQACAWSMVVVSAGSHDANSDANEARHRCSGLDGYALGAAKARAFEIMSRLS